MRHAGIEVLRVLAAGALGLALAPLTGTPAWAAQPEVRWPAHFEVEARRGNDRTVGQGRFFVPAWQDDRNLVTGIGGQAASFVGTTGTICVNGTPEP